MTTLEFAQAVAQEVNGEVTQTEKANGVILTGVTVKSTGNAAPTFYVENMMTDGLTVNEAVEKIREALPQTVSSIDMSFFEDFEQVKPRLRAHLYNQKTTADVKRPAPAPFDDLIVTAVVNITDEHIGNGIIRVKQEHLKLWNVTADEVLDIAEANSKKDTTFQNMNEVLLEMGAPKYMLLEDSPMWVVSNTRRANGAYGVIALMDQLKEKFGSFTILPSSVHEVIIVTMDDPETFDNMVQEVNDAEVDYAEQLSNHSYRIAA